VITMPEVVEEVEVDQPKAVNVASRFKFSDVEMVKFLTGKKWTDFKRDKDKPLTRTFKVVFFADKNAGKSHNICTIAELDKRNPKLKLAEYAHVAFLLEEGLVLPGNPLIVADMEGKFDNLRIKGKFKNYPIRYVDVWHPDGPMPNMQNPVEVFRDMRLFLSAGQWAHNNPVQYKQMTAAEGLEGGLDAPNAMAVENYTILTTEIMNYARVVAHPENIKELEARGQELGAPIIPKFDNWSIRDGNWDFLGGFTQRLPMHYAATCRQRQKWVKGAPTDQEDLAQYKMAKYAFNVVVNLYKERDPVTDKIEFWGQIIESDFMDEGIELKPFKNPCFLKVVAEITKYSHAEILDKYGTWKESPEGGLIWVKNKVEKPAPATTSKVLEHSPEPKSPRGSGSDGSTTNHAGNEKVEAKPVETATTPNTPVSVATDGKKKGGSSPQLVGEPPGGKVEASPEKPAERPSVASIRKVISEVNAKVAKPAMKPAKPRVVKPVQEPKIDIDRETVPGSTILSFNGSQKELVEALGNVVITSTDEVKELTVDKVLKEAEIALEKAREDKESEQK